MLRLEAGGYLCYQQAADGSFRLGYHKRDNAGGVWARVSLTVGADLLQAETIRAGVLLSNGNATASSVNAETGHYACVKVKGAALAWCDGHAEDPYAVASEDGSLQPAQIRSRVEGLALETERYDTRTWQGALETG